MKRMPGRQRAGHLRVVEQPPDPAEVAALALELARIEQRLAQLQPDVAERVRQVARIAGGAA